MRKNIYLASVIILTTGLFVQLAAQNVTTNSRNSNSMPAGILLFVDGDDFTIYRNAVLHSYDVAQDDVIGMNIEAGDFVQTGRNTTLEIQMLPGQSVVKVAENTSFRVISNKTTGVSGLEILYGKIRSRVDSTLGGSGFYVQGKTAVAGVRGTDFGYDIVAVPGSANEPSSRIYTYEGTVQVQTLEKGSDQPAEGAPSFDVPAGSTLTVVDTPDAAARSLAANTGDKATVLSSGSRTVLLNKSILPAVDDYWKKNDFKAKKIEEPMVADIIQNYRDPKAGQATTVDAGTAQMNTQQNRATRITAADLVEPLQPLSALDAIKQPQYYMGPDALKTIGIITTSTGILALASGLALYGFGSSIFTDMSATSQATAGLATTISAGVFVTTGITLFLVGMQ